MISYKQPLPLNALKDRSFFEYKLEELIVGFERNNYTCGEIQISQELYGFLTAEWFVVPETGESRLGYKDILLSTNTELNGLEILLIHEDKTQESISESTPPSMIGWVCPVCGKGLSPFITECSCKGFNTYTVTCVTTGSGA